MLIILILRDIYIVIEYLLLSFVRSGHLNNGQKLEAGYQLNGNSAIFHAELGNICEQNDPIYIKVIPCFFIEFDSLKNHRD